MPVKLHFTFIPRECPVGEEHAGETRLRDPFPDKNFRFSFFEATYRL